MKRITDYDLAESPGGPGGAPEEPVVIAPHPDPQSLAAALQAETTRHLAEDHRPWQWWGWFPQ